MARLPSIGLWRTLGRRPDGARQRRVEASPQWGGRAFANPEGAHLDTGLGAAWDYFTGGSPHRKPETPVPIQARTADAFAEVAPGVRVTWLGHGTSLVETGGRRFLVDPVWGDHAAPSPLAGVRRFHPPPLALADLPPLDAVLVTHDHYDHLDAPTVAALAGRVPRWICPLGVGARLEGWGVPPEAVTEVDWWEAAEVGGVTVAATPARHFSGRFLTDRNTTLWCGFALAPPEASGGGRVLVGGDGGYTAAFRTIGERLGPFDVALMEIGAYNQAWADIHMGPEQAVQAALDARARLLLPVHWATFDLALHGWTEPGERVLVAAREAGLPLALPRPGESVTPEAYPTERWWPALPWQTADEAPVVSASVGTPEAFAPPEAAAPEASGVAPPAES